jgi:hypothetical protein
MHYFIFSSLLSNGSVVYLKHYATSRKVAGSILDEITSFLNCPNLTIRIISLGSTQIFNISAKNLLWGKRRSARKAHNRHLWADCLEKLRVSMSHSRIGVHSLLQSYLY